MNGSKWDSRAVGVLIVDIVGALLELFDKRTVGRTLSLSHGAVCH